MSKQNKVNPDHYKTGGRLTPDDAARERTKQRGSEADQRKRGSKTAKTTPGGRASKTGAK